MPKNSSSILATALLTVVSAGCSGEAARQTLTTPSPLPESAAVSPALTSSPPSTVRHASAREARVWASTNGWATPADGLLVEGTDTITAISDSCPTKTITVRGVPVALTATTTFTAPLTCETLAVDASVKVTALLTFTASGFTVVATNIAPNGETSTGGTGGGTPGGTGSGKKARGEGVVGAITGTCPTLTMVITGTHVSTTSTTEWIGGTCETLRPGTKVTIDGELKPGGTAVAERVEIRSTPGRRVSGDGRVDAITGDCPAVTLNVRGVNVITSGATTFTGGACADLGPGSHVDVTGDYDGTELTATSVHIKKP